MYLVPVQSCPLVKGHSYSIFIDFEHFSYYLFDNESIKVYEEVIYRSKDYIESYSLKKKEFYDVESILSFLLENDMAFWGSCNDLINFTEIEPKYSSPSKIDNAIIDIGHNSTYDIFKVFTELEELGCSDVQLRFFYSPTFLFLHEVLKEMNRLAFVNVQLVIPYQEGVDVFVFKESETSNIIDKLIVYSSPFKKNFEFEINKFIVFTDEVIIDKFSCGVVHEDYFTINIPFFSESLSHNTCLNKKISVDESGNIRNCPSSKSSYGNIMNTSLNDVISQAKFTDVWRISKEQVSVCKECHYRRICPDCRVYTEDINDLLSKPLKCGYNPYLNIWEEWSQNPLKQQTFKEFKYKIDN